METKNIVPRVSEEGKIGTREKLWGEINAKEINLDGKSLNASLNYLENQIQAVKTIAANDVKTNIQQVNGAIVDTQDEVKTVKEQYQKLNETVNTSNDTLSAIQQNIKTQDSNLKSATGTLDSTVKKLGTVDSKVQQIENQMTATAERINQINSIGQMALSIAQKCTSDIGHLVQSKFLGDGGYVYIKDVLIQWGSTGACPVDNIINLYQPYKNNQYVVLALCTLDENMFFVRTSRTEKYFKLAQESGKSPEYGFWFTIGEAPSKTA